MFARKYSRCNTIEEIYLRYASYILLFFVLFLLVSVFVVGDISFTDLIPPQIRCCPKPGPVFSTPYVDR